MPSALVLLWNACLGALSRTLCFSDSSPMPLIRTEMLYWKATAWLLWLLCSHRAWSSLCYLQGHPKGICCPRLAATDPSPPHMWTCHSWVHLSQSLCKAKERESGGADACLILFPSSFAEVRWGKAGHVSHHTSSHHEVRRREPPALAPSLLLGGRQVGQAWWPRCWWWGLGHHLGVLLAPASICCCPWCLHPLAP